MKNNAPSSLGRAGLYLAGVSVLERKRMGKFALKIRGLLFTFPGFCLMPQAVDAGLDFNDFIFLAANRPNAARLKQRAFNVDAGPGTLLSDNINPLEHLQTQKAEHYRHTLVDWSGADLLVP